MRIFTFKEFPEVKSEHSMDYYLFCILLANDRKTLLVCCGYDLNYFFVILY